MNFELIMKKLVLKQVQCLKVTSILESYVICSTSHKLDDLCFNFSIKILALENLLSVNALGG